MKTKYRNLKNGEIVKVRDQIYDMLCAKWTTLGLGLSEGDVYVNKLKPICYTIRRKVNNKTKK